MLQKPCDKVTHDLESEGYYTFAIRYTNNGCAHIFKKGSLFAAVDINNEIVMNTTEFAAWKHFSNDFKKQDKGINETGNYNLTDLEQLDVILNQLEDRVRSYGLRILSLISDYVDGAIERINK